MFLFLEVCSRIFIEDYGASILKYDNKVVWKFTPNLGISGLVIEGVFFNSTLKTNSKGFRDYEHSLSKNDSTQRIIFIGDSYTAGILIPEKNIFPRYLENKLNQNINQNFEILNFGVPGYATDQEYLILKDVALGYKPDVLVLTVSPNDFREAFAKGLFYMDGGELRINKSNKAFNLSPKNKFLFYLSTKSYAFVLIQSLIGLNYQNPTRGNNKIIDTLFFKEDKGISHPDKVLFLKDGTDEMADATILFTALIEKMNEICTTKGIKFVLVNLPIKLQFEDDFVDDSLDTLKIQKILKNVTSKNNILFLDLYPLINESTSPLDYYIREEYHLNEKGHQIVGDELYNFLIKENLLE